MYRFSIRNFSVALLIKRLLVPGVFAICILVRIDTASAQQSAETSDPSPTLEVTLEWLKTRITSQTTVDLYTYMYPGRIVGYTILESYSDCILDFSHYTKTFGNMWATGYKESTEQIRLDLSEIGRVSTVPPYYEGGRMQGAAFLSLYHHNGDALKPSIFFKSQEIMERVSNALRHAVSICNADREPDPF